ncbi:hypothetical protein P872_08475 [Rhodonellum psychrophilum GCM71 = DSM 17998]|uniref:Outer membrane protein beta-barrel domain-containing protein n=2 Tax=Rhodonellum TaxID=336827 RepID=U5BNH3_9BACT|nr:MULTISPECIES: hypothetical protein [Rhodonellum]ERM82095.1 hypothetical protein P872_08475 [Rhodonellum psychrophilum GCM71 = DSM 17998]MDO9550860.1 hypothetical protein [Rhodonellum sp.]SDZ17673.1 hypothetical protein SAMN05444412_10741 [Rhodonellum ikkaensis]
MFKKIFGLGFILSLYSFVGQAQEKIPTQSVFVELGGAGLIYSFNYEFRFDKENLESWGLRVGAGGYGRVNGIYDGRETNAVFTLPVQVTRLFGKGKHFFEVGGGTTFIYAKRTYKYGNQYDEYSDFDFILESDNTPAFMGTLNLGYRRIPVDGGFTFRANLTPIFNQNGFWPIWAGVGFGYAF